MFSKNNKYTSLNRIILSLFVSGIVLAIIFYIFAYLHIAYHKNITLPYILMFFILISVTISIFNSLVIKKFIHNYLFKLLIHIRESADFLNKKDAINVNDKDELTELEDNIEKIIKQIKKGQQDLDSQNQVLQVLSEQQKIQLIEIKKHMDELQGLYNIGKVINSNLNLDTVIDLAVSTTSTIMKSPLCSVRILDPKTEKLMLKGSFGLSEDYKKKGEIRVGESIAGRVVLEKKPIAIKKISNDSRIKEPDYAIKEGINSLLCVPLIAKDRSIGVISVYSFNEHDYSDEEMRLLSTFASQISIAIENARLYEETKHLAITDGLTNIYNHKYFREQLSLEIQRAERYNRHLSLIMIDVDNFKIFNDTYGHPAGDLALIKVANIIMGSARKVDIVARYGGEEFTVILPETDSQKTFEFADRLRKTISEYNFIENIISSKILKESNINIMKNLTISTGISTFPNESKTDADLINNADNALYAAKNSGKNKVCVYSAQEEDPSLL